MKDRPGFHQRIDRRAALAAAVALAFGIGAGCVDPETDAARAAGEGSEREEGRAEAASAADLPAGVEAVSLLGRPLRTPELGDSLETARAADLAEARERLEADPASADALIWVGRRQAYLGRYREAIATFTRGIRLHPEDPRLYRHRGHRLITVRELERAAADLERAAALIEGTEDRVEPDGLPNARGVPTSTLHFNIWYHLGLARYLAGDFEGARDAYRRCLAVSRNPDARVAASHWLYTTLRRLRRPSEAAELLRPIHAGMDVIENHAYHRLLLLYRGEVDADSLWSEVTDDPSGAAIGYGVAAWHLYEGRPDRAFDGFRRIVSGDGWAGFGYIAAEAELARARARDGSGGGSGAAEGESEPREPPAG